MAGLLLLAAYQAQYRRANVARSLVGPKHRMGLIIAAATAFLVYVAAIKYYDRQQSVKLRLESDARRQADELRRRSTIEIQYDPRFPLRVLHQGEEIFQADSLPRSMRSLYLLTRKLPIQDRPARLR